MVLKKIILSEVTQTQKNKQGEEMLGDQDEDSKTHRRIVGAINNAEVDHHQARLP
ncbi:hypothetical protein LEMLEM_LOCUS9035 [Lemmus lemmus]